MDKMQYTDAIKFTITDSSVEFNGDVIIEGWASKEGINAKGNNVLVESYSWEGAFKRFNGRVMAFHRDELPPIGKVEKYQIVNKEDNKGLWVRARIFGNSSPEITRAIKEGVLDGFSLGYNVDYYKDAEANGIGYDFHKIDVYEVSIVNIGANEEAVFKLVDSLKNKTETNKTFTFIEENQMDKKVETALDNVQPVLDQIKTEVGDLKANEKAREAALFQVQDALNKFNKGEISDAVKKTIMDNLQPVISELTEKINKSHSIAEYESDMLKISTKDFMASLAVNSSNAQDHAYLLFHTNVDYKSMGSIGDRLCRIRNLRDGIAVWVARERYLGHDLSRVVNSKWFQALRQEVARFSKPMADAMGSPNTGYGLEWVSQNWSSEMQPYVRVLGNWISRLRQFENIDKLPFQAGRAKSYYGNINYIDNAERAKLTNIDTGVTSPTYVTHKAAVLVQDEFDEDSIIEIGGLIRFELGTALVEGFSRAFLNGDTAASHFDTGRTYGASDLEAKHNGLRKYVFSTNSAAVAADSTSATALADADIRDCIQRLGKKGIKPMDLIWIAPIQCRGELLGLYANASDYGAVRTKIDGVMPTVYGSEVYIDGEYPTDLNATGIYDDTTKTYESIMLIHTPSWGVFSKRDVTLEFDKDIMTGQFEFVASARRAFERIVADDSTNATYSGAGIQKFA